MFGLDLPSHETWRAHTIDALVASMSPVMQDHGTVECRNYPAPIKQAFSKDARRSTRSDREGRLAKKPRASKPKAKSGCITCKIRHVKCDETKPGCLRCKKFGCVCDGYAPEPPQTRGLIRLQPRVPTVNLSGPSINIHTTEEESRYFQFFAERTAFEFSGFWDSTFWSHVVLQESHNISAIRHAAIALGALHKSLLEAPGPGLKVNVIQSLHRKHHDQAALQHSRAIQALSQYIALSKAPQLRSALIACLLFVCFEIFQGSYASAVRHTYSGLKILKSYYIGKPGSRPWIPRKLTSESTIRKVQNALQTREGVDNINRENMIAAHVEQYLESENRPELPDENRQPYTSQASEAEFPASSGPDYDPQKEHVHLMQMKGTGMSAEQERTRNMYTPDLPSRPKVLHVNSLSPREEFPHSSLTTASIPQQPRKSSITTNLSCPSIFTPPSSSPHTPSASQPQLAASQAVISRNRPLASRTPTPPLSNDLSIEDILIQSFSRLDGAGLFFGMNPGIPPLIWDVHQQWHIPIPSRFTEFPQAQKCWDFLMDRSLQFYRRTLFNRTYAPETADSPEVIERQYQWYITQLERFENAFSALVDTAIDYEGGRIRNAAALVLSLYLKCTKIMIHTLSFPSELTYDRFLASFRYVVSTASLLIDSEHCTQRRYSFEVGIVPPLHVVATKCRDPIIRRQAISLLWKSQRQEGMWDSVLSARIASWLMKIEEEGVDIPMDLSPQSTQTGDSNCYPSPPKNDAEEKEDCRTSEYKSGRDYSNLLPGGKWVSHGINESNRASHDRTFERGGYTRTSWQESPREEGSEIGAGLFIPEENRVQLTIVDFHIPERYIIVKCQNALGGENRETLIAW